MDAVHELMQKVRRIEMRARKDATAHFAGQFRSSFRGQGLDFDDFREYSAGDEPRFIDWKVTARTGTPYVRKFFEEREQVLLLAVDVSASMRYASAGMEESKQDYAARIAAVLAYSAAQNGDKVGLLLFGGGAPFYLPPAKGMQACLRIVREVISPRHSAGSQKFSMEDLSHAILHTQRKPAMLFLISDFLGEADQRALGRLAFRHELIPVRLADPMELALPEAGQVRFCDPESHQYYDVDLSQAALRAQYAATMDAHRQSWATCFRRLGVDFLDVTTADDFIPAFRALFAKRSRHFSH